MTATVLNIFGQQEFFFFFVLVKSGNWNITYPAVQPNARWLTVSSANAFPSIFIKLH